jgi:hypothetical protein
MKIIWIVLGAAVLAILFLKRKPAGPPKSPTATSGTAGPRNILAEWFPNSGENKTDNTAQLLASASNAFGGVVTGLRSIFSSGSSSVTANTTGNTNPATIGDGIPVDLGNGVQSQDLGGYDGFLDWGNIDNWNATDFYNWA